MRKKTKKKNKKNNTRHSRYSYSDNPTTTEHFQYYTFAHVSAKEVHDVALQVFGSTYYVDPSSLH